MSANTPSEDSVLGSLLRHAVDEFTDRRRRGERPSIEDFTQRYPEAASFLRLLLPAVETVQNEVTPETPPTSGPPGYEILDVLGKGGMGVVYRARQVRANRIVALKMILAGGQADESDRSRFQSEAEAIARVQHPGIVQIHEVGEQEGQPFFALEFCPGGSLAARLKDHPLPPTEAADLVRRAAEAIAAAHQHGIVHRDLKPANVLLAADGTPKVADFGLAKHLDAASGQTQTGAIVGTPSYLAPEQAAGRKDVGPAADIYGLGALLYECLTGHPPFRGATILETLEQVLGRDPIPPRQVQPRVPRDLDIITLKCLQKHPRQRYATAQELADDLQRFLDGRPIRARRVGFLERGVRWARRNPVVALLGTGVTVSVLVGFLIAIYLAGVARQEAARARTGEATAWQLFYPAQMALVADAWDRGDAATVQELLATLVPRPGQEDLRDHEWHYFWRLIHGHRVSVGGADSPCRSAAFLDSGRTLLTGGPQGLRLWDAATGKEKTTTLPTTGELEVRSAGDRAVVLRRQGTTWTWWTCSGESLKPLVELNVENGDGPATWVVAADRSAVALVVGPTPGKRRLTVWNVADGSPRFQRDLEVVPLAFSPDGKMLVVGSAVGDGHNAQLGPRAVTWLDAHTGEQKEQYQDHRRDVLAGAFSAVGNRFVSGSRDATALVQGFAKDKTPLRLEVGTWVDAVAVAPDGKTVATGPGFGLAPVRLWDAETGKNLRDLWGHSGVVRQVLFSPDGTTLAAVCDDESVKLWDARPAEVQGARVIDPLPSSWIEALAFAHDGRTLASAGHDATLRLWDVENGRERSVLRGHAGKVLAVTFDRGRLASGSTDQTLRLWDAESGRELARHREPGLVASLAFLPDDRLALAAWGAGVRLRRVSDGKLLPDLPNCPRFVYSLAVSPDGSLLAAACHDRLVCIWDVATRTLRHTLRTPDPIRSVAFSADGRRLFAGGDGKPLTVWDVVAGKEVASLEIPGAEQVRSIAVSADGRHVAAGRGYYLYSDVHLWKEPATKANRRRIQLRESGDVAAVACSPDGRLVAAAHPDGTIALCDTERAEIVRYLPGHAVGSPAAARSADGSVTAEVQPDFTVLLLDENRRERVRLRGHTGPITALVLSADGESVVTGSFDRTVRLWDVRTGAVLRRTFTGLRHPIRCVALAPDGRTVAAGEGRLDVHGEVMLWDADTGVVRATLRPRGYLVLSLAFSPDSRMLAIGTGALWENVQGKLALWDATTGEEPVLLGTPAPVYVRAGLNAEGHLGNIVALAFSSDGRWLASGSDRDGTIRLWDVNQRRLAAPLRGQDGVSGLAFSSDGRTLAAAGVSQTVRLWDVQRLQPRGTIPTAKFHTVTFAADGRTLFASGLRGMREVTRYVSDEELRAYDVAVAHPETLEVQRQTLRMQWRVARTQEQSGDKAAADQTRRRAAELAARLPNAETIHEPTDWRTDPAALANRAFRIADQGGLNEAIALLRESTRLRPTSPIDHYNLAVLLRRSGRDDEALISAREAVRLNPTLAVGHNQVGFLLCLLGRDAEAVTAYREAIRIDPDEIGFQRNLAVSLMNLGQWSAAADTWREVLRRRPNDAQARKELVFLSELEKLDKRRMK